MTQLLIVSLGSITFAEFSDDFSNVFNIKINIGGRGILIFGNLENIRLSGLIGLCVYLFYPDLFSS